MARTEVVIKEVRAILTEQEAAYIRELLLRTHEKESSMEDTVRQSILKGLPNWLTFIPF